WLDPLDWRGTHKPFWGAVTPILATGRNGPQWTGVLLDHLASRIDPAHPLETWCEAGAPPKKVISCVYHITAALDAGCLVYPHAELLFDRLLTLGWENVPDAEPRTDCTDGDWAFLLLRLSEMRPGRAGEVMEKIRRVSARRVRQ